MALCDLQFFPPSYVRFPLALSVFSDSVGKEDTDLTNSSSRLKSEISYQKIKTDKSFF